MRYNDQTGMYDAEDTLTSHDTVPFKPTPPTHSILELDS